MPTQKLLERKALIVGIVINVLQVLAGVAVFFMTGLKAMFLDFSFTAISVLSGMVAVYLSSRTVRTTERFPNGMFALEPIYAICKAIFTMSLLVYSLIDVCRVAYDYFVFHLRDPDRNRVLRPIHVLPALQPLHRRFQHHAHRRVQEHVGRRIDVVRHRRSCHLPDAATGRRSA